MAGFLAAVITSLLIAFAVVMLVLAIGYAAGFACGGRSTPGRYALRIAIALPVAIAAVTVSVHYLAPGSLPPYLVIAAFGFAAGYKGYKKTTGMSK
ncbi:MAG: hypothetical protein ACTMKY_00850 [Dermabacteraceae bacterium]